MTAGEANLHAATIPDPALRQSYLTNIPEHRNIVGA